METSEWTDLPEDRAISQGETLTRSRTRAYPAASKGSDVPSDDSDVEDVFTEIEFVEDPESDPKDESGGSEETLEQIWEVCLAGVWTRFDAGTEQMLQAAHVDGRAKIQMSARGQVYTIDLIQMIQVNVATGKKRGIRTGWMDKTTSVTCSEDRCNYMWLPICIGDQVPERAVSCGSTEKYGDMYVGRTAAGECGAIKVRDGKLQSIRCHAYGKAGKGEILCIQNDAVRVEWKPICKGDAVPFCAIFAGQPYRDGEVYVARSKSCICSKLTLTHGLADTLYTWKEGSSRDGEILVIDGPPLPREGVRNRARNVGWVARSRRANGAPDCSEDFYDTLRIVGENSHPLSERTDLAYLIVPGLFTRSYPRYMHNTLTHFSNLGLDCRLAEVDTGATVEQNSSCIASQVASIFAETGKSILLIGHSILRGTLCV
eukprot:TRINITY_DN19869_c0_g5_i3.p1 TRINITY_DN19869_c0_g5~~TRINITY_DN19869_c0_g5_i3.p1  ORF type:complete len:455 (+),score=42.20 TRINITY_DN19869_c0_g5_i3:78-1367(+)